MRLFAHSPEHVVMPEDLLEDPFDLGRCACGRSTTG